MEFFLSGKVAFNNRRGRALFLAMMDFTPELESTKNLQENLDTYCRIVEKEERVDQVEVEWTDKVMNMLRKMEKRDYPLSI